MPISIAWATKIISVPQSYLALVSGSLYELDINQLRLDLKDLEDSEDGMSFEATHRHNTQVTLSGVTYARTFEIINDYTVTFQNTGTPYTVRCAGANHNLADVTNFDGGSSLIIGNSAGLVVVSSGSGLSGEQSAQLEALAKIHGLVIGSPLTVSPTTRAAGGVTQTISEASGTVTVERTA